MSSFDPSYPVYPPVPPPVSVAPRPPRLHWGWVLGLNIITVGFFGMVWMFVQAIWTRRVTGRNKAFKWTLAYLLYIPAIFFVAVLVGLAAMNSSTPVESLETPFQVFARLGGIVLYLFAAFTLKQELEWEPIGIPLGGVMTFLFAPVYFQYFLHDYRKAPSFGEGTLNLSQPVIPLTPSTTSPIETQTPPKVD